MKAAIMRKFGPPNVLVLEEIEKPRIQDNQVLIKVHATSVNAMDFEQIAEAHAYADKGHKVGSVAISVYPEEVIQ